MSGIVVVVLASLVIVMLLLGHGPGRHDAPTAAADQAFPADAPTVLAELGDRG